MHFFSSKQSHVELDEPDSCSRATNVYDFDPQRMPEIKINSEIKRTIFM